MCKRKVAGGIVLVVLASCLLSLGAFAQEIKPNEIFTNFEAEYAYKVYGDAGAILPAEMDQLFEREIKEDILPIAAELIHGTILSIKEDKGISVGVDQVLGALPDNIAKVLNAHKEEIKKQVEGMSEK